MINYTFLEYFDCQMTKKPTYLSSASAVAIAWIIGIIDGTSKADILVSQANFCIRHKNYPQFGDLWAFCDLNKK